MELFVDRSSAALTLNEWPDSSSVWFRPAFFWRHLKIWLIDAGVRDGLVDRLRLKFI